MNAPLNAAAIANNPVFMPASICNSLFYHMRDGNRSEIFSACHWPNLPDRPIGSRMHSPLPPETPMAKSIGEREMVVMMASIMALNALAIDSMLPAFPAMAEALHVTRIEIQQVIATYLVGLAFGSLIYGPLSDRYGRKPVLLGALFGYAIAGLACSYAPSFDFLIPMRFIHGMMSASLGVLAISIIRDSYSGDAMARRMSTVFLVFMVVPIIAPTMGQAVLLFSGWRAIFDILAVMSLLVALWVARRLPETLKPENVVPIEPRALAIAWKEVITHRNATGYMIGGGLVQGALFGYLNCSQQAFDQTFHAKEWFTIGFAIVAIGIACANFTNARIVERFGARRVSQTALFVFITLALLQIAAAVFAPTSLPIFIAILMCNMAMIGFIGSNFSSIAMTPFGKVAGAASSFQTFARTLVAALVGGWIGARYNGTVLPIALGFLICGLIALAFVLWCEKGKLFTRPGTTQRIPM